MPRTIFLRARRPHVRRSPGFTYDSAGNITGTIGSYTTPEATDLWQPGSGGKINFIKMVREVTNMGLKEAKDVADALEKPGAAVALLIPDMPSEPPTNYRGDPLLNYARPEALTPWVYLSNEDRLPAPLKSLLDEYRKLGSRAEASEKGGRHFREWSLVVDGYTTRAGFRRGKARPDALGPRAYDVMLDLSESIPMGADSVGYDISKFQHIFDLLQSARVLAYTNGTSHDRACADVGALLLHTLTEHMAGQAPPTSKLTAIELLIHEAARRLLA